MIRILVLFTLLFVAGLACVSLLPTPAHTSAKRSPLAAQLASEAKADESQPSVRVVYPAPGVTTASREPMQAAASLEAKPPMTGTPAAPPVLAASLSSDSPQPVVIEPASVAVLPPPAAAEVASTGLNINTASVEALNQIPGVGRVGRTIAAHRPYRSVEDLLAKRVIRRSVYDRIKDQIAAE